VGSLSGILFFYKYGENRKDRSILFCFNKYLENLIFYIEKLYNSDWQLLYNF